jgi:predicted phage terminase large subunit-like protein
MSAAATPAQRGAVEAAYAALRPLRLRYCPLVPTPAQEAFLRLMQLEVLYGGQAGGGKTVAMLMAALQFADVPGYHALLLRPNLNEFFFPGGLIELAHEWLAPSKAAWSNEEKKWRFPGPGRSGAGGATLSFGHLDGIADVARHAGSGFSFLGFDELVRFNEHEYRAMFRTLRQAHTTAGGLPAAPDGTTLADVPPRARATSNPGNRGHQWVKSRFVDPPSRADDVLYLPSRIADNPHLDPAYLDSLARLGGAERERLLRGDWEIGEDGELFQRDWFEVISAARVPARTDAVRYWDLAATEASAANPDPDYTLGLKLELDRRSGTFYITHIVRERRAPGAVEALVKQTADADGREVAIVLEQEPGAAGKTLISRYIRTVLQGYNARGVRPTGAKDVRARPVAAAAQNGLLKIVPGRHVHAFLDELAAFPNAAHDDCVDALAGAHTALARGAPIPATIHVARGRIPLFSERYRDVELAARIGVPFSPAGSLYRPPGR